MSVDLLPDRHHAETGGEDEDSHAQPQLGREGRGRVKEMGREWDGRLLPGKVRTGEVVCTHTHVSGSTECVFVYVYVQTPMHLYT